MHAPQVVVRELGAAGALKETTRLPCGFMPCIRPGSTPSFPDASMPWITSSMLRLPSAKRRAWRISSLSWSPTSRSFASALSSRPSVSRGLRSAILGLVARLDADAVDHPRRLYWATTIRADGAFRRDRRRRRPCGSTTAHRLATAGRRVLLVDKARFPRDKPWRRADESRVRQLPISPDPVVEHVVDRMGFRLRYGARFERTGREHLVLHDAASGASTTTSSSRLSRRGPTFVTASRSTDVQVGGHGASVTVAGLRSRRPSSSGLTASTGRRAVCVGLGGEYVLGVAFEGNVSRSSSATVSTASPSSSSGRFPGGTPGSSPRATTSTWASAAGRETGRPCATISASFAAPTGSPRSPSPTCAATGCRCGAQGRSRAGAGAPRRRRGRSCRPLSGDGMYEAFASSRSHRSRS